MKKIEFEELKNILILSDVKENVFIGYTTYTKRDVEGEKRVFEEDKMKYLRLTDFAGATLYVSEYEFVRVLLTELEMELDSGDYLEHGYPEARLIPSDHGEKSLKATKELYFDEVHELIREVSGDIGSTYYREDDF